MPARKERQREVETLLGKGEAAKRRAGIEIFQIPKRSPDLNVCDYALWKAVDKRMRAQEKRWPKTRRETRKAYLARLCRTAKRLPPALINRMVGGMRRRCQRLYAAKGGLFEEGGYSK